MPDTKPNQAPYRPNPRRAPDVKVQTLADGSVRLDAPSLGGSEPASICAYLYKQAADRPNQIFLAERAPDGNWATVSYAQMLVKARAVAQWLISNGFDQTTPAMVLSANSLNQAALTFGALMATVPLAPVSPPYSLNSGDFGKLKACVATVKPALIYVEDTAPFSKALAAIDQPQIVVVSAGDTVSGQTTVSLATVLATKPTPDVEARFAATTPEMVAKILFTSGSTGMPKAVINTHRNLVAAPAMRHATLAQSQTKSEPDIVLDWLPWHHTFGGNAVLNGVLYQGNSLYIDAGRPLPGQFAETIRNIIELRPTQFSSVPAAFGVLAQALEENDVLRAAFFERIKIIAYGGAALGQDVYERIQTQAVKTCGQRIHFATGCGSTETGSLTTGVYWTMERMGAIGLPLPGTSVKLRPQGDKFGLWVKGDQVSPGYLGDPALNVGVFDEDGYFDTGDAVTWIDQGDPLKGLMFAGRLAENFKLASGTWVLAGAVRLALIDALSPFVHEAVIAGQDRDYVAALVWPNPDKCRALVGAGAETPFTEVLAAAPLRAAIAQKLAIYNATAGGAAAKVRRVKVLLTPPSIDNNEITDKRYINQRAVLDNRSADVASLYLDPLATGVFA